MSQRPALSTLLQDSQNYLVKLSLKHTNSNNKTTSVPEEKRQKVKPGKQEFCKRRHTFKQTKKKKKKKSS